MGFLTKLTERAIRALKPRAKPYDEKDGAVPGLYVTVAPAGAKTFTPRFQRTQMALGRYGELTLKVARYKDRELRQGIRAGKDPREAMKPAAPVRIATFSDCLPRSKKQLAALGRDECYIINVSRLIKLHSEPTLDPLRVDDIKRGDIRGVLEAAPDKGLTAQVNRIKNAVSGVFTCAVEAGLVEHHPLRGLRPIINEVKTRKTTL